VIRNGDYEMRGKYQGVLFCSDCPGVWTEVTLEDSGPNLGIGRGAFVMTERYTGGIHGGETVVTTGQWLELRAATKNAQPRYFRCEGGRRLTEANADGTLVTVHMPQNALTRVIPRNANLRSFIGRRRQPPNLWARRRSVLDRFDAQTAKGCDAVSETGFFRVCVSVYQNRRGSSASISKSRRSIFIR
jgi:hypothetical protein